jgi:hypothetical protein
MSVFSFCLMQIGRVCQSAYGAVRDAYENVPDGGGCYWRYCGFLDHVQIYV